MDELEDLEKFLAENNKSSILQEMGLQNVNNFLVLDDRQEEAKRLAANATPRKFGEMIGKLSDTFTSGLCNAATLLEETCQHIKYFKTGIPEMDSMLLDGLSHAKITEITGGIGSGKTQLCTKLILRILAKTSQKVLFIDSGASFSIERIEYYCKKLGMTKNSKEEEILKTRMKHIVTPTPKDLMFALISLIESLEKGKIKIQYVFIDSFSSIMNLNLDLGDYEECLTEVYRLMKVLNSKYVGLVVTTIAKAPNNKSQKPKSILTTPWNFMPQNTFYIENLTTESNRGNSQKAFYRITLLSADIADDLPSSVIQLNMHPSSPKNKPVQ